MGDSTEGSKEEPADSVKKLVELCPLIKHSDMNEEMKAETMDLCVFASEKYSTNHEKAARMIKESMDKKYGAAWHVVVGEAYGLDVTHELSAIMERHTFLLPSNSDLLLWHIN